MTAQQVDDSLDVGAQADVGRVAVVVVAVAREVGRGQLVAVGPEPFRDALPAPRACQ
ncbi:MAG: hypothetical protein J0I34_15975 [Pseudonocardia sp.]|uniref:hypothetical protein n=1 Tax=unclassified Pseudonocardia TaxID=2619320 RepID=UPI001AD23A62|nr:MULTISPECIES: hypothetical protein [unclassified Pseudonocardia]MBN9110268.1 hypothetical protein [Pseudonocardia sp.]